MEKVAVEDIVRWTGGRLIRGAPRQAVAAFSTDSRTLRPGDFFFPLRGPNFDGHGFIGRALAAGAAGIVCAADAVRALPAGSGAPGPGSFAVVAVRDTGRALLDLAAGYRRLFRLPVAAVTGSAGKTTTKDLAAWILGGTLRVLANRGNLNNQVGLPLSVLNLEPGHQAAIFELGMNHPGEIAALTAVVRPRFAVITNIGTAHLGLLGSRANIAAAKAEILGHLGNGTAILPADDRFLDFFLTFPARRRVTFGLRKTADVRVEKPVVSARGTEFRLCRPGRPTLTASTPLAGEFNLRNIAAAAALAGEFEVPDASLADRLAGFPVTPHRFQLLERLGACLVDDTYNANPSSYRAALTEFARLAGGRRRIAVCGCMGELGRFSGASHRALGRFAAGLGLARLIPVGPERELIRLGACRAGFPEQAVTCAVDYREAAGILKQSLRPGDWALLKGSRFLGLERILAEL